MIEIIDLKKDFEMFGDETLGILLFGSYATGEKTEASDIDICIVKPQNDMVLREINRMLGGKYDIKVFESLPLYMQMEVINRHLTVYGNEIEISEYFYKFRRLWNDAAFRVNSNRFTSVGERMNLRKRWQHAKREILKEIGSF